MAASVRVAVVGAGSGGAQAALTLRRLLPSTARVTVYERTAVVGGRSRPTSSLTPNDPEGTTADPPLIETGGAIFVDVNRILMDAAKEYKLELRRLSDEPTVVGIWDGKQFAFQFSPKSIIDNFRILYHYGLSPLRAKWTATAAAKRFTKVYENKVPYESLGALLDFLQLEKEASIEARSYLCEKALTEKTLAELVEPLIRVNYAQNLSVSALASLICLIPEADQVYAVKEGNAAIFERWLESATADVRLNTTIASIKQAWPTETAKPIYEVTAQDGSIETFDSVILCTSLTDSDIQISLSKHNLKPSFEPETGTIDGLPLSRIYPPIEYVTLHVTFVTGSIDSQYFSGAGDAAASSSSSSAAATPTSASSPSSSSSSSSSTSSRARISLPTEVVTTAGSNAPFLSLSEVATLTPPGSSSAPKTHVYKLFSHTPIDKSTLESIFVPSSIRDVRQVQWKSYPYLTADTSKAWRSFPVEMAPGLFHGSIFEPCISTLETAAISGRNAAQLASKYLQPEKESANL